MSSILSLGAFAMSSLLIALTVKRNQSMTVAARTLTFTHQKNDSEDTFHETKLTKEQVQNLRDKHFSSSLSVSYANSGPLMIISVCYRKLL